MSDRPFNFKLFMVTRSLGSLCDQFLLFAVPLAVLHATGSARFAALAFVIEWLPRVIGFPLAGAVVDGLSLKRVFLRLDLVRVALLVVAAAALGTFGVFGTLSTLMACMSLSYVVNFLAIEATIPNNLAPEDFPRAHSVVQGVEQASQVVGPALAAVIYGLGDIRLVLLACAALFAVSAVNTSLLAISDSSAENSASIGRIVSTTRVAVGVLLQRREVVYLSGLTWVVNLVYGTALAISAAVVVKHFERGSASFGGMQSAAAVVALIVFAAIPALVRRAGVAFVGRLSLILMIASGFALGLAPFFLVYAAAYCLLIAFDGGFNVYVRTMRSTVLPKEHLAKIMGIIGAVNLLSIPVAGGLVSVLAGHLPLLDIILVSSALSLTLCLAVLLYGRFSLGYTSWFPPIPTAEPVAEAAAPPV
ncbi:MFS transporter [Kineosporia mesophila]|uniref:MFS transporter n=1 Tax=Kineosporia mesophila TaxID=566012 RepID=A0ABP7ALQ0_9ACTN|nr:MFS transporter [Kineosporia mesophila]MCD5353967.1 MFS transporter [Kineosporia mesophila]